VLLRPCHTHNVFHRKIPHQQSIRNQRPMAAPRHRLSTHDRRRLSSREFLQARQPSQKLLRLHVIRKPTKTGIVPTQIPGVRLRMPQTTQFFQMHISNPCRPQTPSQSLSIKLWIVSRTRNAAHIHHAPHPMRSQHLDKFRERPRRMANRKNRTPHFLASHAHLGSQNTFCTGSTSSVPSLYQVCAVFACPQC
jgi:hypothetical protein